MMPAALSGAAIAQTENASTIAEEMMNTRQLTRGPRCSASSVGPLLSSVLEIGGRLASTSASTGLRRSTAPKRLRSTSGFGDSFSGVDASSALAITISFYHGAGRTAP